MMRLVRLCFAVTLTLGFVSLPAVPEEDGDASRVIIIGLRSDVSPQIMSHAVSSRRALDRRGAEELRTLSSQRLRFTPHFDDTPDAEVVASPRADDRKLRRWLRAEIADGVDAAAVVARLRTLSIVEHVYIKPRAVPASFGAGSGRDDEKTPDYVSRQGYLRPSPHGVNALYAWQLPGGSGKGITITDIEGDWNKKHEDLRLEHKTVFGERAGKRSSWYDHGTAVIGVLGGRRNGSGVTGIAWGARIRLNSIFRRIQGSGIVDNVADAIYQAARRSIPGDIVLLEVQYAGLKHSHEYVPVEFYPDVFDAIRYATDAGITVVEAAGNGNQNLDAILSFRGDSGAIFVAAGSVSGDNSAASLARDRKRLWFSNYGERIDVQNWGERVVTTGYGDLLYGGHKRTYTESFNGTSSAAAITAGVCAVIQGVSKETIGRPLSPGELRDLLVRTGTPQQGNRNSFKIGPRPDLKRALRALHSYQ